jgi:serine/threonine protein kinase
MASADELIAALKETLPGLGEMDLRAVAGQKRVFRATFAESVVALKAVLIGELAAEAGNDDEQADIVAASAARLEREIHILKKCNSPSIVRLSQPDYQEIRIGNERYGVYAEQWIDGDDLRSIIKQRTLSRDEVIELGLSMCSALEELDRHGYVHRDIKPANVMRQSEDGHFILVDPGMALERTGPSLTSPGAVPGTAPYMSPEQWDPRRKRDLDVRSDMFALGAVMFEALTQVHPFYEQGMSQLDIMAATRSEPPKRLERPDIANEDPIREIIQRLLARNPHSRYRDTEALKAALEAAR